MYARVLECHRVDPMLKRHSLASSLLAPILLIVASYSYPQTSEKKKVTSQADLPRFAYPVCGSYPSKTDSTITSGLPTIRPEPEVPLPAKQFEAWASRKPDFPD